MITHRCKNRYLHRAVCCAFALGIVLGAGPAVAGAITGTVTVEGRMPQMRPVDMGVDPVCAGVHGDDPVLNESILMDDAGRLANVFVQVVEGVPERDYPVPEQPLVLSQEGCMYRPRVFGLRAGQPLKILNPDGTMHNVNAMPRVNDGFNLAMTAETKAMEVVFDAPEPVFPIKCDVHAWMRAFCAVVEHPYFAVSEADGSYRIEGLSPGTYVLEAWHERLGTRRAEVRVDGDGDTEVDWVFSR